MNTFVDSINSRQARTENGMKALSGTSDAVTDLFYKIGGMRGRDVIPAFVAAFIEDTDLAVRVALWARDIRQGAGERKIFRDILSYLEKSAPETFIALVPKVPELGRWDDLLIDYTTTRTQFAAYLAIHNALIEGNGLAAKWMPRKGPKAVELRNFFGWSPKRYRKTLVDLTKVVESQMCANDWDNINFSHVPSVASARYKKAFYRHTPKYAEYVEELVSDKPNKDKTVKINAGAVYPYDVIKNVNYGHYFKVSTSKTEEDAIRAQWDALPDYMDGQNVLAMIDVSGSMETRVGGGKSDLKAIDVAVSLGLYTADKSKGAFKDVFLTFNGQPDMKLVRGNIIEKAQQIANSWDRHTSNTNLHAAFDMILHHAVKNRVPVEDMPTMLVILSDMQFDSCGRFDDSAVQMINRKYSQAGYVPPKVVFWNLRDAGNVPAKVNDQGVALVSGFSPSLFKAVLSSDLEDFTPRGIMLKTIMSDRYSWQDGTPLKGSISRKAPARIKVQKTEAVEKAQTAEVTEYPDGRKVWFTLSL